MSHTKMSLPHWATGVEITPAHLASIEERAESILTRAIRVLPSSRTPDADPRLAELLPAIEVLRDDVSVLLAETRRRLAACHEPGAGSEDGPPGGTYSAAT